MTKEKEKANPSCCSVHEGLPLVFTLMVHWRTHESNSERPEFVSFVTHQISVRLYGKKDTMIPYMNMLTADRTEAVSSEQKQVSHDSKEREKARPCRRSARGALPLLHTCYEDARLQPPTSKNPRSFVTFLKARKETWKNPSLTITHFTTE